MGCYNPFSLEGKTILVVGSSSGIGRAAAIECSKLGAKVILSARNEDRLKETVTQLEGEGHSYYLADIVEDQQIIDLVSNIEVVQGVVLCAGQAMTLPFTFSSTEKFEEIFKVNFYGNIELLRMLVKKKKLQKESSVVFVSSIGGIESFQMGNGIYGASKAAFHSMMKTCAKELASKNIRVNSVNPGTVNTRLIQNGSITKEQYDSDIQRYPLKRYGEPEDIAHGISYLLSDASSWVTGHALVIDGGVTI